MHKLISAIVYADDEEEARAARKELFDRLVDLGVIDYHDSSLKWRVPEIAEADSEEGKKAIEIALDNAKQNFIWAVEVMRTYLQVYRDNEELYEDEFTEEKDILPFRYLASIISNHPHNGYAYLFDADGNAIYTEKHLHIALEHQESKVYVVSADVHI